MRRALAIVGLAVVAVFVAVLIAWPRVERRVLDAVRDEAGRSVEADLAWEDADLALVAPFPSIGVEVEGLTVTGRDAFAGVELARVERLTAAVDLRSLFGDGPYVLRSLGAYDAQVHAIVDAQGRANYDILADGGGGATELRLDRIAAEDVDLLYEDQGSALVIEARDVGHRSSGDIDAESARFDSDTSIGALTVRSGEDTWLADTRWLADLDVQVDRSSGRIEIPEGRVTVDELPLDVQGAIWPVDGGYGTDVAFRAADDALAPLLSLLPPDQADALEDTEVRGSLALEGTAKGSYLSEEDHWPALSVDLDVRDGALSRPGSPAIEDIAGVVRVRHPEGPLAATTIEAPSLRFSTAGQTLDGSLAVADLFGDPRVQAAAKGAVDVGALDQAFAADDTTIAGVADVDLRVAGRWSDLEAQNADAIDLQGTIRARDGRYESPAVAVPLQVDTLAMTLGPRSSQVEDLRIRYDGSDLAATGTLENVLGYLAGEGPLGGTLDVSSQRLDLTKLVGESAPAAPAIVLVPADLALTVRGQVGEAVWKDLVFEDARGAVTLQGGEARLRDVEAGLQGARIAVSGTYAARSPDAAHVDLDARLTGMDVGSALTSFPSLGAMVPYLASATGEFDATMAIDTQLGPDGSPVWPTFTSQGAAVARGIEAEPAFLGAVAQQLSNARFERLTLDDTTIRYKATQGRLQVVPFDAKIGGADAELGGAIGLVDRSLDLDVTLEPPADWVKASPLAVVAPADQPLTVTVDVKGSWEAPQVGVDVERLARDVVQGQVERVRGQVDQKLEEEIRSGLRRVEEQLRP